MEKSGIWKNMLVGLIAMYILTAILLLFLAVLTYRFDFSSKQASVFITAIYIVVGFFGGFLIGKRMRVRKFLFGALIGIIYFSILVLVSLIMGGGAIRDTVQLLVTFVLLSASSMIGGMIS